MIRQLPTSTLFPYTTLFRSFNMIWRVPEMRSMAQRFSNYLSVIMVGPLLMVSAIGATATVFSSDMMQTLMAVEPFGSRSEEHTSELQSRPHLVCRLLLEKKN